MVPNPASLLKKAGVEAAKQAVKNELKKETKAQVKKKASKTAASSSTKKTGRKGKEPQRYKSRPGKEWKEKIQGKAQVTGGKKNPDVGHSWKSRKEAIKAAKRSDVTEVQMDLGVNRMLPKGAKLGPKGNRRPDVAYKTKDGKLHQVEVESRTDVESKLLARMKDTKSKFPEHMQGEVDVIKRIPD